MAERVQASDRIEDIAIGLGAGAAGAGASYLATEAWRRASERTVLDGKPARSMRVDAASLAVDADTFQFKSGGDQRGVTDRLQGVKQWNAAASGKVIAYEYADGRRVIADGHQRLGLAQRLMSEGHAPIKMDAVVLRQTDGWSPRDVRAYAAIKNMHESSGNALDMARVMRERPDLVTSSLPVSDLKVREAKALAHLSDDAFKMVASGAVEPGAAAAVGEAVRDPARHVDMIREMADAKVRGAQHARLYVQQAMAAPSISETSASLFGEETQVRSLIKERSAVLDKTLTTLKGNRKLFAMLEREADTIESAGNKLAHQANTARADTAGRLSTLVEKLAMQRGNVSRMLDEAAKAVAAGEKPTKAARGFMKAVQATMEQGGIRALVGDGPLPLAASGGMQRMAKPTKSFVVHDIDGNTVEVFRSKKEAHEFALARNREQPVLNNSTKLWVREDRPVAPPKGQTSFLPDATTKEQVAAAAKAAGKPAAVQQAMDEGLFGSGMKQMDLVDRAREMNPNRWGGENRPLPASPQEIAVVERAIQHGKAIELSTTHKDIISRASNAQVSALDDLAHQYRKTGAMTDADFNRVSAFREAFRAQAKVTSDAAHNAAFPGWSDAARQASAEARAANAQAPEVLKAKDIDFGGIKQRIGNSLKEHTWDVDNGGKVTARVKTTMKGGGVIKTAYLHLAVEGPDGSVRTYKETAKGTFKETAFKPSPHKLAVALDTRATPSRKGKKAADMARIHQEIRDTLGPRGDGKHRHTDGTPIAKASEAVGAAPRPTAADASIASRLRTMTRGKSADDLASTLGNRDSASVAQMRAQVMSDAYGRLANRYGAGGADDKAAWAAGRRDKWGKVAKAADQPVKVESAVKHPGTPIPPKPTQASYQIIDKQTGNVVGDAKTLKGALSSVNKRDNAYGASRFTYQKAGWSDAAREASAESRGVAAPGEAKAPPSPKPPKGFSAKRAGMKFVGQSATLERGPVNVYLGKDGLSYVTATTATMGVDGRPLGLRMSPSGIDLAVAKLHKEHRFHEIAKKSTDAAPFTPVKTRAAAVPKAPPVAQLRADAAKAGIPNVKAMKKPELLGLKKAGKFSILGPLAVVGAGAVAFDATRSQAQAAGRTATQSNLDAAGAAAIASGSVAAVGYGITKAVGLASKVAPVVGKVAMKALPAVAIATAGYEIGKGAIKGYQQDGLAGAAKGAGAGALDWATLGAYSHFTATPGAKGQQGRLSAEQQAQFSEANANYAAMKQASASQGGTQGGWSDQARISAYITRAANAGVTPENLPYGGVPRSGPTAEAAAPEPKPAKKT